MEEKKFVYLVGGGAPHEINTVSAGSLLVGGSAPHEINAVPEHLFQNNVKNMCDYLVGGAAPHEINKLFFLPCLSRGGGLLKLVCVCSWGDMCRGFVCPMKRLSENGIELFVS